MPAKLTSPHHWLLRYGGALAAVGAGYFFRVGLTTVAGEGLPTYITFYPVVMAVALLGGFGPGLVATVAAALVVDVALLPPRGQVGIENLVDAVGMAVFLGMGLFMSLVAELYRRARQKAALYEQQVPPWERQEAPPRPLGERLLLYGGMALSLAILAAAGWQTQRNMTAMAQADRSVTHTYVVNEEIEHFIIALQDMDTSVRTYVLTAREDDLRPYTAALPECTKRIAALKAQTRDNPAQTQRVAGLETLLGAKLAVLQETIAQRRTTGFEAAQALVATGKGLALSLELRRLMDAAQAEEDRLLAQRTQAKDTSLRRARQALFSGGVLGFLILGAVFVFLRQESAGRRQAQAELGRHRDYLQDMVTARTAELAQANDAMRRDREDLDRAQAVGQIGSWRLDVARNVLTWSDENHRLFGVPKGTPLTYEAFLATVHPEDRQYVDTQWQAAMSGQPYDIEHRIVTGGEVKWVREKAYLDLDAAGKLLGGFGITQDITERKQAERALRESEQFIQSVAAASPHWLYVFDCERMGITYVNRPLLRDLGYPPEIQATVTGLEAFRAYMPPEEMPHLARLLEEWQTLPDGRVRDDEYRLRHADGTLRYFAGREVVFARGADGAVQRILGLLLDITDRKTAEEALRASQDQLRQHVAELQAANEEVQRARQAALSLAEDALEARKETERVNANLHQANKSLETSRGAAMNLMEDAVRARKQAERAGAELERLNRTLRAHSKIDQALLRTNGEAEFLAAVCRIVVEDCGHAMVWIGFAEVDEARTVRPAAQAGFETGYLETLRVTWADTERGRGPTGTAIRTGQPALCRNMLTDPKFAPWRAEALKRGYASSLVLPLLAEGQAFGALTIYSRQPDGFSPDEVKLLTDLANDLAYGITALRLREAKAQAEAALRQTTEDLQRSNRDLEQFAYVASHDLQEPLRAVGGYVKLLQHRFPDKLDAKARDYIAGAFEGATRMERLITDLLAFSRVGTHGGHFVPAELEAVLERALGNLVTAIKDARATVTHEVLPTLAVDATQMMQLFQNLIGNALKFHGEAPPKIHVGAQRQDGRWVFSVRDNGIGIEAQYYEKIFHIFQRLHTRKDYPGTGIGLAICKKIVERHGGTIWVESQPGQGATFYFSLPEGAAKPSGS